MTKKEFRRQKDLLGLTIEELAKLTGKSWASIAAYASDKNKRTPPPEIFEVLRAERMRRGRMLLESF